ncbi:hypothetical protein AKJ09_08050 [Labilithrix luteola]|uniref:Uncharacterized protein n=1 Tax=Labilithrix luteola TaxID=1391654 RepID=A0A0K1Q6V8_9BACT|nr:NAD(P)-dependent oxidoreductase [Labilithrix luteola]AKV01387.1 hypothetical protein AKJ09_08050 [Labilithrix luteola]
MRRTHPQNELAIKLGDIGRGREELPSFRIVDSPAEAARGSEVVLTRLANDKAAAEVVLDGENSLLRGLGAGAIQVATPPCMGYFIVTARGP